MTLRSIRTRRRIRSATSAAIAAAAVVISLGSGGGTAAAAGGGFPIHAPGFPATWSARDAHFGGIFGELGFPGFGGRWFGGGSSTPTAAVGNGPFGIAIDQATHTAYVGNTIDGTLSVINTDTCNAFVTTGCAKMPPPITVLPPAAGPGLVDAAVDEKTDTVYFVNDGTNTIAVIDGATCNATVTTGCGQTPETITLPGTVDGAPDGVAVDDATDTIYVSNANFGTVSVINGATCNANAVSGCGQTPGTINLDHSGPAVPAVDEATDTVYVPNGGDGTVSVIDGATCNATVRTGCANVPPVLTVGGSPGAAAIDQASDTVYVVVGGIPGFGSLNVFNGATCDATVTSGCGQTPTSVPAGANAFDVAIDPVTHRVFVLNQNDSTVSIVDGATCNARDRAGCAQRPSTVATAYNPGYLAIDIANDTVYVADYYEPTVSLLNGAACTLTNPAGCRRPTAPTTPGGAGPGGTAVDEATGTLYVSDADGNTVSVIATASCNAFMTFGCGRSWPTVASGNFPGGVGLDQQTDTIYVANPADNTVSVINGATCNATTSSGCGQTLTPIDVGGVPVGVTVDEDNHSAYVANVGDGTVSMINTATCNGTQQSGCAPTQTLSIVGTNIPDDYVVDEKTDTIYATNSGDGSTTVSVINGATCNATNITGCTQVAAINVGASPSGLAINEMTDTVYAINQNDGPSDSDVSVINAATCNVTNLSGCNQSPPTLGVGTAPNQIAVDPATDQVFVSSPVYSATDVYNGATCRGTVTWGCGQTPLTVQLGGNPGNPVADLAHDTVYVPDGSDDEVSYFPAGF
jgi:DNA-binding beta-propeller fold protein YncE